jgi:hypothetical protein
MHTSSDMDPEHTANWPKSRKVADAISVAVAVVYTQGNGLAAEWASDEQAGDARAVELQEAGHRAWFVMLEDDGWGMVGPPAALGRENTGFVGTPDSLQGHLDPLQPQGGAYPEIERGERHDHDHRSANGHRSTLPSQDGRDLHTSLYG